MFHLDIMLCLDDLLDFFQFTCECILIISFACWYLLPSMNPSEDNVLLEQYKFVFLSL